ncbi:MAG TPA: UPF0182 family protein [Gemmatimonadaceae bacterium]|nr:UPF0182 family protein [Gemmatimonadaceae bacterium]
MTIPADVRQLTGRRPTGGLRVVVIAIAVVLAIGPAIASRLADWLWYRDVGFERVFLTMIVAQWSLGLGAALVAFALMYLNARIALRGLPRRNLHIRNAQDWASEGPSVLGQRLAAWFVLPAALLVSLIVAFAAAGTWRDLAQFFYRTPFGTVDPVFGRDIAYYVFSIPMIQHALTFANAIGWVCLIIFTVAIYVARGDLGVVVDRGTQAVRFFAAPRAQVHLAVLAALLLVVRALRLQFVDVPSLLLARRPVLFGATYTDLHLRLPMMSVLALVMVAAAIYLVWQARKGQLVRAAAISFVGIIVATVLLSGVVPNAYQRLVVQPNELARETPQIRHHLAATRQAWGIDSVERRDLTADQPLTMRDIQANMATIRNVRLWDREPLLQTYGQIQSIRTYYDFVSVDDDRYVVNGELRQVLLAPREMNTAALPTRTFINEHLTYTHGMGVTLGPSNQVTAEGLPVLWIKDLPPVSSIPIKVTRPQIYFGEQSNEFIMAPTRQQEFDYPAGEGDAAVYSTYDGGAGVSLNSFARRLLFAFRFGSMNILLSDDLTAETRILFHRDVLERAELALPFVRFDPDPYMVIADDGTLKWILDAYTSTERYPYSQPLSDGTNYLRNSVKVVIDAYTGETRAYLAEPNDPMIRTLGRIYPGLLRPLSEMPADLRAHLRYPGMLFGAQSSVYALFHMTEPATFYGREDQWQVPTVSAGAEQSGESFMRHIVMRLPGEQQPEFILMRPFTPRRRDNLAAWMVVRNDGENYGKLRVYRFPRQSLVFGPAQIVNRMTQDAEVARQISLWDQRGSEVIRGELLVIPIEESLIYVQPLYLRASGGRIPELKRVVVAHESQVAMEETLEKGLAVLFGGATPTIADLPATATPSQPATRPATSPATTETAGAANARLIREAGEAYDRARAAQRNEDWATYGTEMRRLGDLLRQLRGNR